MFHKYIIQQIIKLSQYINVTYYNDSKVTSKFNCLYKPSTRYYMSLLCIPERLVFFIKCHPNLLFNNCITQITIRSVQLYNDKLIYLFDIVTSSRTTPGKTFIHRPNVKRKLSRINATDAMFKRWDAFRLCNICGGRWAKEKGRHIKINDEKPKNW